MTVTYPGLGDGMKVDVSVNVRCSANARNAGDVRVVALGSEEQEQDEHKIQ